MIADEARATSKQYRVQVDLSPQISSVWKKATSNKYSLLGNFYILHLGGQGA